MGPTVSKSRSKRSRQRAIEERKKTRRPTWSYWNLIIGGVLWMICLALLQVGSGVSLSRLLPGRKAPATIVSEADFKCRDLSRTELLRRQAADNVLPVFEIRHSSNQAAERTLNKLGERLHQIQTLSEGKNPVEVKQSLHDALDLMDIPIAPSYFISMAKAEGSQRFIRVLRSTLENVWTRGIVTPFEKETNFQNLAPNGQITVQMPDGAIREKVSTADLLTPGEAAELILEQMHQADIELPDPIEPFVRILQRWLIPNLVYNPTETSLRRDEAASSIESTMMDIPAGTTLVEARERITQDIYEKLTAHERRLRELESPAERLLRTSGNGLLMLTGIFVSGVLILLLMPGFLREPRSMSLMAILVLLTVVISKGLSLLTATTNIIPPSALTYLVPLALAPLLASILVHPTAAVITGICSAFLVAVLFGHYFIIFATGLLATVISAYFSRDIQRRSRIFRVGLYIGLSEIFCVTALAILDQQTWPVIGTQIAAGLLNGLFCAFSALALIPLFELTFGLTTDIRLLELSDMSHPLLQRLALEAPGTYHHSLMVAHLAEAAARRIGAHALLVRVAAYYHDIGKLTKPEFYIENSSHRDNPHDDLTPSMSTLVVMSHVKEGVTLAKQHKLPLPVLHAIQQHHGTGLIRFFYHRAIQQHEQAQSLGQSNSKEQLRQEDYRYPGPRPVSREMAILELADSVEAASRSLEKRSVQRIENMVEDVIKEKLLDGQLDTCKLTLSELLKIKESFVFSLNSMLHGRIAYPNNEDGNNQSTDKKSVKPESTEGDGEDTGTQARNGNS